MKIHVPEDMGGKLKVLPEVQLNAKVQDLFLGESKANNPKVTVKWVITEECKDKKAMKAIQEFNALDTTVGENVLESFSLLPNAIWNLNDFHTDVTGSRLPMGDYSKEEFEAMLKSNLIGAQARLDLTIDHQTGSPRTIVNDRVVIK